VKLRYTLPALAELNSILDYIAAHSPRGAKRVQRRLQSIIDLLLAIRTSVFGRTILLFAV